jgi:putative sugar O-methyltransferase
MTELDKNTSALWDLVKKSYEDFDLESFRAISGVNNRLGVWNPIDPTTRYYKSLAYEFAHYLNQTLQFSSINEDLISLLSQIPNQNVGAPPTLNLGGIKVSLDYLLAIEEYAFCYDALKQSQHICEIGAGFGRTCHSLLSLNHVQEYTIIDLPEILSLSKAYLSSVLSRADFAKINFIKAEAYQDVTDIDLVINIDSMQEMPKQVAQNYLDWIALQSHHFFSKNAMGKYHPSNIDLEVKSKTEYSSALEMGLLTQTIEMFEFTDRSKNVQAYHKAYCPDGFHVTKTQRGYGQYSFYELSLFSK